MREQRLPDEEESQHVVLGAGIPARIDGEVRAHPCDPIPGNAPHGGEVAADEPAPLAVGLDRVHRALRDGKPWNELSGGEVDRRGAARLGAHPRELAAHEEPPVQPLDLLDRLVGDPHLGLGHDGLRPGRAGEERNVDRSEKNESGDSAVFHGGPSL